MTPKQIEQINRGIEALIPHQFVGLKKLDFWYRPNGAGYTRSECDAGRYTLEEAKKREYLRGDYSEHVIITPFSPRNWFEDERTRPQILAALSDVEIRRLITAHIGKVFTDGVRKEGVRDFLMENYEAILRMDQPTLAKLFCAVKNIEIEFTDSNHAGGNESK
jgi:hypothetical protein